MGMQQNRRILLSLFIGIAFSGAAVFVSFKNVPLAQLLDYMETIDLRWVVPSILLGLAGYLVRVIRWQVILKPVKKIGFWHTYHPLTIAFMINCVLPGRVGELARPAILYKRDKVAFSKGLATVGVERIFDLIALLVLFVFVMSRIDINPDLSLAFNGYRINRDTLQTIWTGMLKAGIVLICLIVALMLPAARSALSRFVSWLPYPLFFMPDHYRRDLGVRLHARTQVVLDNIALGFEVLKSPAKIIVCFVLSLAVWMLVFWSFYVLTLGCRGVNITFLQASAVTMFICFFIMLPSVPGFWGIWEIGGIYGLMIFGVPKVLAAGATLAFHAFQIIPVILLGMISAWVTGVNILQAGLHSRDSLPGEEGGAQ
jgi:hypothetical protein